MKALDLVLVAALVIAPIAVSLGHSNNTFETVPLISHGSNPETDEYAYAMATLFGLEITDIAFPGTSEAAGGCNGPYDQEECEGLMWVPQWEFDQCFSCYLVCYDSCEDCEWWMFCNSGCHDNLYGCSGGEIDL